MHFIGLRKRQRFADESADALSKGVVPSFDMVGLTGFFADHLMFAGVNDGGICLPKIAE